MTKTISVKELRMNFPKVRDGLEQGVEYTIIYRSKPIATLSPLSKYTITKYPFGKKRKNAIGNFLKNIDKYALKTDEKIDSVKLIRKDRGYDE